MTLYANIKDDILAKIESGTYAEGQIIPSEVELSGIYGVSRSTIRQALQILVSTGYLEKRKRRGTIVTRPKVDQSFTTSIRSFEDDMRLIGKNARTNVLLFRRVHPSEEVVARLGVRVQSQRHGGTLHGRMTESEAGKSSARIFFLQIIREEE